MTPTIEVSVDKRGGATGNTETQDGNKVVAMLPLKMTQLMIAKLWSETALLVVSV